MTVVVWLLLCAAFIAAAWYFWLRDSAHKMLPKWRQFGLLIGLIAGVVNLFFCAALLLIAHTSFRSRLANSNDIFGWIGFWFSPMAFVGAAMGESGRASVALSIGAVLGGFLWVPFGVL